MIYIVMLSPSLRLHAYMVSFFTFQGQDFCVVSLLVPFTYTRHFPQKMNSALQGPIWRDCRWACNLAHLLITAEDCTFSRIKELHLPLPSTHTEF